MPAKAARECGNCHKANGSPHPICNVCRQGACKHDGPTHYDSSHAKVCECGLVLHGRLKKMGFGKRGVFPMTLTVQANDHRGEVG